MCDKNITTINCNPIQYQKIKKPWNRYTPISETVNGSLRSNSKKISLSSKGEITDRIVTTSQRWIIATSHPLSTSDWHHLRRHCRDTDNGRARHWHRFAYYDSSLHNLRVGRDDIRRDATLWTVLSYPSGIL